MNNASTHMQLNKNTTMPSIGFGTYLIGNDDTQETVTNAIEAGFRHIDTAEGYQNEEGVGAAVKVSIEKFGLARDQIFITTKLWPGNPAWGHPVKTGEDTLKSFEDSLLKLKLDYVDLYLIHAPFATEHRLEQWKALIQLQKQDKVRSIGVSNYNQSHLQEIKDAGLPMPDVNQIELHPWSQKPELISFMSDHQIKTTAYSSLAPLSTWRVEAGQDSAKTAAMKTENGLFSTMANKYGVTEAQLLLRWGVQNGYAVLPKSMNPERMKQNLDLFSFSIDNADMVAIQTMDRGDGIAWAGGDPSKAS